MYNHDTVNHAGKGKGGMQSRFQHGEPRHLYPFLPIISKWLFYFSTCTALYVRLPTIPNLRYDLLYNHRQRFFLQLLSSFHSLWGALGSWITFPEPSARHCLLKSLLSRKYIYALPKQEKGKGLANDSSRTGQVQISAKFPLNLSNSSTGKVTKNNVSLTLEINQRFKQSQYKVFEGKWLNSSSVRFYLLYSHDLLPSPAVAL